MMPPRIRPHRLPQAPSYQCFRTRPNGLVDDSFISSRQFHNTTHRATRLRADMFAWLDGPGKVFRDPSPLGTNYLGAYTKQGTLRRAEDTGRRQNDYSDPALDENEAVVQKREREEGVSEEIIRKRARVRDIKRREKQEMEASGGVPREQERDLKPYPLNPNFRSQAVLSEPLRERIYELIVVEKHDLKSVSAVYGVDIRRVAAVVRLKSLEKQWLEEGKKLAKPYNDAVLAMLPQTPFDPNRPPVVHEPINDLPVHPATRAQLFIPTSESRAFTREDAAKAFHPKLLPADERIPNPELVQLHKWETQDHDRETRLQMQQEMDAKVAAARELKDRRQKDYEARTQVIVPGRRWDFKFQNISAEKVGKDGRGRHAVGHRYGMPLEDRKRGQVKIPTSVE